MTTNADIGLGTLLKIGDGGGTEAFTTIAEIKSIRYSRSRPAVDATTMEDTSRQFIKGIKDGGEVTFDVQFIPTDGTHDPTTGIQADWNSGTLRNFQLVHNDSGSTTWTIAALVTNLDFSAELDSPRMCAVTLKVSGVLTES